MNAKKKKRFKEIENIYHSMLYRRSIGRDIGNWVYYKHNEIIEYTHKIKAWTKIYFYINVSKHQISNFKGFENLRMGWYCIVSEIAGALVGSNNLSQL